MLHRIRNYICGAHSEVSVQMEKDVHNAVTKINFCLYRTGENLRQILDFIECSEKKETLEIGLKKIDNLMRYFHRVNTGRADFQCIRSALEKMGVSQMFSLKMKEASSLQDAMLNYKTSILHEFAKQLRQREEEDLKDANTNQKLFDLYFKKVELVKPEPAGEKQEDHLKQKRGTKRKYAKNDFLPIKRRLTAVDYKKMRMQGYCFAFQYKNCKRGNSCKFKHIIY